jgi:hypothetical protein
MGMNEMLGIIGYKLIMGVLIGLIITGIILMAKYAIPRKPAAAYAFEQFEDVAAGDPTPEKMRTAIAQFQKNLLIVRTCARETCSITKVCEDLFAKNLATLDTSLDGFPPEMKSRWEKYRAAGASQAFQLYKKDYMWTNNNVPLLECFESDELSALVNQIYNASQSNEFKASMALFMITLNSLRFNQMLLDEMKKGSDAIKSSLQSINVVDELPSAPKSLNLTSVVEGFVNKKDIKAVAKKQLESLAQFHTAVENMQNTVNTQKETLNEIVKTFKSVIP